MKRILFSFVFCVALFVHCTHPYEDDLLGSFPYAEFLSENSYRYTSDSDVCVLEVSTNMVISTKVNYVGGADRDWITIESSEEKGGIVRLKLTIDQNLRRELRSADVKILADGSHEVETVRIDQQEYSVVGKQNVCEGDLVLKTQDEVNNCIYTQVNGNLIIGDGEDSNIHNLSKLDNLTSVKGGIKVVSCLDLVDMGPIGNLKVSSVEFDRVTPYLVSTYKGEVKDVTIKGISEGMVSLDTFTAAETMTLQDNDCEFTGFSDLKNLKVAQMSHNAFESTEGFESMKSLETLDLSYNPLLNVNTLAGMSWVKKIDLSETSLSVTQINYLKEMLPQETEIVSEDLSGEAALTLTNIETKYFTATFESSYRGFSSSLLQFGYVLLKADEKFNTENVVLLERNMTDLTFELEGLESNTEYYIWLYALERNGAVNVSESVQFTTMEVIEVYEGDLVLRTQEEIYECVHKEVKGNLTIGMDSSDIHDLSTLSIGAVSGGVTIKGCQNLTNFGVVATYTPSYLELDGVKYNLAARWTGKVKDLRIRNITSGTVNVAEFEEVTSLTLQNNECEFSGLSYLKSVTDAVISGNQFTTTDDFKYMTLLKAIDLSNNPLVNVNTLADMTSLQEIDLSETKLSATQVNYLEVCLPDAVIVSDDLKGTASLTVQEETTKYSSANLAVEYSGISYVYESGYILNITGEFSRTGWQSHYFSSSPESIDVKGLDDDTDYYMWVYIKDSVGSVHLSDPLCFRTQKIVYNYVGDLVLETQEDVDECVHTTVQGNLTIGGDGSDIDDLSSLPITAITGNLTIKGCTSLTSFGAVKSLNVPHVILDNVSQSILSTWEGNANELTVKNIKTSSTCYVSDFDEVTKLTITDNKCQFSGLDKLVNVTEANLSGNRISDISAMTSMTKLTTLDLSGNPLANINPLVEILGLASINLSDTPLSQTQIRYLVASLPKTVVVKADDITGTAEFSVSCGNIKYYSAAFDTSFSDISGITSDNCGYYINTSSVFPGIEESHKTDVVSGTFEVKGLEDGTKYWLWVYASDSSRSIHLSEPVCFTTNKVIETYVGDITLKTQEEVDECYNKKIDGNLTIDVESSDITDLSQLRITSVTGKLTVKGSGLNDLGPIGKITVPHVHLDAVDPAVANTWDGSTSSLTVTNIQSSSNFDLSKFDEITSLTLNSNSCQFTGFDSLINVTEADLSDCNFTDVESLKGMTSLRSLNLSGNPLTNINALAQMDWLTSITLDDTPLSQSQLRYIINCLPSIVTIYSNAITGNSDLSVSLNNVKYFTASMTATITGISGVSSNTCGYYLNTSSAFPGIEGRQQTDITSGTFEVTGMEDGTKYWLWVYAADSAGSIHLSESVTVETEEINDYEFTLNPIWPIYANDETLSCAFTGVHSNVNILQESNTLEKIGNMMPYGNNYTVNLPEGELTMGFVAVEGTPERNSFDGYTWTFHKGADKPGWTLEIASEDGCSSDIALAVSEYDFDQDATVSVDFVRPVAKVNMTVDFAGSVGNLSNIDEISISTTMHYDKFTFTEQSTQYDFTKGAVIDHSFSTKVTEIPVNKKVKVATDRYVFPQVQTSTYANVTLHFKDGMTKTTSVVIDEIQANNSYDFTFEIVLTDGKGSFTVDVIERVEDNIEF